jgi:Bacterial PH domain
VGPLEPKDVSVKRSMTQRTRKCGDVEITSADASTPKVTLAWIQNPDQVAEQIRQAARAARKRHGVATQERF